MADRFASGETTNKFSVDGMSILRMCQGELIDSTEEKMNELKETLTQNYKSDIALNTVTIYNRYDPYTEMIDRESNNVMGLIHNLSPIIANVLWSWPMRLLNHFQHWYTFSIYKDPIMGNNQYVVTIIAHNDIYDLTVDNWKSKMKQFKHDYSVALDELNKKNLNIKTHMRITIL